VHFASQRLRPLAVRRLIRARARALAGMTYIMQVPATTLLLSYLIRKAILRDH